MVAGEPGWQSGRRVYAHPLEVDPMFGAIAKRTLLALVPIAILATGALALSGLTHFPAPTATDAEEETVQVTAVTPSSEEDQPKKTLVVQKTTSEPTEQIAQQADQAAPDDEPLPELVVDRSALTQAAADVERAIAQVKLAVTALDADAQTRYIQETINILAGAGDPAYRPVAGNGHRGVRPLLVEARVVREAAEVQWVAAVQRQLEARARKQAELTAQAGAAGGPVQPAPPSGASEIASIVGSTGVLGTRGMRPEEQAADLVSRALRQSVEALGTIASRPTASPMESNYDANHASDQAVQTMESVLRTLDSVKKIIRIALDR